MAKGSAKNFSSSKNCCGFNKTVRDIVLFPPTDADPEENAELREDGSFELREDGGKEIRD